MKNGEIAEQLNEIADLLDVLGERFKPEAYRRAARSIESMAESAEAVSARGALREVPGVGEAIDEKVRELLRSGSIAYLVKLRASVPPGLRELMRLPGLGPKTARRFWTEFGIEGPAELDAAIRAGRLAGAKGLGEKRIAQFAAALASAATRAPGGRRPIERVVPLARALVGALRASPATQAVEVAGSYRRCREDVGDLDILVTSDQPELVFDLFSQLPEVESVRLRGPTKETVVLRGGLQVDLRVVEPAAFGAALQYFTGSKDHNVRLRSLARERGLKINEYGVFRGDERVGGTTETEVYGLLDLDWIPPELREDRGEIDLARAHRLPKLLEGGAIVGDLHVHLPEPAGPGELDDVLADARARRLAYVGVIVADRAPDGTPRPLAPATLERMAQHARGTPRLLAIVETDAGAAPLVLPGRPADGRILRPGPAGELPPDLGAGPTWAIAHFGDRIERPESVLALARAVSAAVDVGPGGADSNLARAAREAGVPLHVPTGVGRDPGDPRGEVALGFARRAGAATTDVINAEPLARTSAESRRTRR